ncbi:MAG: hypothetical protein Roseis2KO_43210 [Roseivirga sp.]
MKNIYLKTFFVTLCLLWATGTSFSAEEGTAVNGGNDPEIKNSSAGFISNMNTANDDTPPTIVANDITVFTRDDRCSAVVEHYEVTANDPSGIKSLVFDFREGTVFSTGVTEVEVIAEDNAGNIATEIFTVTVIDNVVPTMEAYSITLALDENGAASLAIPLAPLEIFSEDFDSEEPGLDLVELNGWNVTEGNVDVFFAGQFGLPISNKGLELSGNINGAVESKNSILFEPGNYRLRLDYRGVTGDAALGIEIGDLLDVSITGFVNEFYEPAEFDFTVTETTSTTIIFREFGEDFEFSGTLIDNVRILRQPDSSIISSVYDNCQVTDITVSQSDFTSDDLGINLVTITVTDAAGNTASTEIEVEVIDNISPAITANDMTVFTRDDRCSAVVDSYDLTITDASGIQTQFLNFQEGTVFPTGVTEVTVFARDNAGNVATDSFTVTVIDNVAPGIEASGMQVFLDENGQASLTNTSAPEVIFLEDFEEDTIGRDRVTLTNWNVVDGNVDVFTGENRALPTTNIALVLAGNTNGSIESKETVTLTPGNYRLRLDYYGESGEDASFSVQIGDVLNDSITDFVNEFFEPAEFDFVVTETITAPIRITEFGAGNPGSGTIIDNVRLLRQPDFMVYDNCQVTDITVSQSDFTSDDLGINLVTITVSDAAGNTASTEIEVEVIDNIPPVITANDMTVFTRDDRCSAVVDSYDLTITDASGIQTQFLDFQEGTVFPTGVTEVTVFARDNAGNVATDSFTVTVIDNVAPGIEASGMQVFLDENGQASLSNISAPELIFFEDFEDDAIGRDQVALTNWNVVDGNVDVFTGENRALPTTNIALVLAGNTNGTIESKESVTLTPGNYRLRLDYYGESGEDASFSIQIGDVLNDSIADFVNEFFEPAEFDFVVTETITAPIRITEFGGGNPGSGTIIDNVRLLRQPDFMVYDNCQVTDITVSQSDFTCDDLGINQVTITVADAAGNMASAEIEVEVIDNIAPVARTRNITVALGPDGTVTIDPSDIDYGSSDNCDFTLSLSKTTFNCGDVSKSYRRSKKSKKSRNSVILTVTDAAGNSSSATAFVRVIDNQGPVFSQEPITLYVTGKYSERLTRAGVASRISDNCSVGSFTFSGKRFTTTDKGLNRVRVTAFDRSGNKRLGSILVNVVELDPSLRFVEVCLKNRTIKVSPRSVQGYIRRGATLGRCSNTLLPKSAAPKTVVEEKSLVAEPVIELSAYPNPTNGGANITFSSTEAGRAVLTIFNSVQSNPTTLFDQDIRANVNQKVTFDTSDLPIGVYILRLNTAEGVKVMKLIVKR